MERFSVKKPYTILVSVILVIILGVVSLLKMSTDLLPNITLPYIIVMTTYPGASPETVEMTVTKPIEASMATISNVENISSTSGENYSMVILEFTQTASMDSASLEIRESLDQLKSYWDDSIGNPTIMKLNPNMLPVMVAAVGVEGMDINEISDYTNTYLLPRLESIEGVASATASGLLEESVHVLIREDKIAKINEQVFGVIDDEMKEAEEELEEGEEEIIKGQEDLAEGWEEIYKNTADLEEARKELEEGKAELASKKDDLTKGKEELKKQKEEASEKLAENTALLVDGIAQIEANIATLNMAVMQMEMEIKANKAAKTQLEEAKAGIESLEQMLPLLKQGQTDEDNFLPGFWEDTTVMDAFGGMTLAQIAEGITAVLGNEDWKEGTWGELSEKFSKAKEPINEGLETFEQLEKQLNQQKSMISQLQEKKKQAQDGLEALTKGEIEAAAGFGSAEAQMAYGEAQLEMAEEQMESGIEQIESGEKQIDSAKEQLEDAKKQLDLAKEQLEDGREQLKEAKEDAYLNADMNGVLTVDTVKALLTAQNFSMPGGYITEDGVEYLVRIGEKPENVEELAKMPIMNLNMEGIEVLHLEDVADVFMSDNSAEIYTKVDGSTGVMVSLQKQTGYSTGDVSDKINDTFRQLMEEDTNLKLINMMDQGIYIDMVMESIFSNIIYGFGLAIIVLILFLKDFRPTLVIAISVPVSLVTALVCMYFGKITLNVISLSGLALGIGMLVDNSIVVIENIYRLRSEGASMIDAAIEGTREVAGAIAASTLTTVCVFLPIVFTEGIARQLFMDMGLTIGFSLIASLVIAVTVVPALSSKVLTGTKDPTKENGLSEKLGVWYEKILDKSLNMKFLILFLSLVLFIGSIFLSLSRGTAFLPEMDSNQMSITLTMAGESTVKETAETTDAVIEKISEIEDISNIGAMLSSGTMSLLGGSEDTQSTTIYIITKEDKQKTNQELAKEIEKMFEKEEDFELQIQTAAMDLSALSGSGISIQIKGREIDTLQKIATEVAEIVSTVEGTEEVSDGQQERAPEVRILIDRKKAMDHGLTVGQIFGQLSGKLAEPTSSTILTTEIKEYDVMVMSEKDENITREDLKSFQLETTDKEGKKRKVPLEEVASFEEKEGLVSINRDEQTRYLSVTASIADGYNVGLVSADVEEALVGYELPGGYLLEFTGENESIVDAMEQLMLMLALAIAFMYFIMVAQFQSLLSPFIIMFTIPLAFTGGFLALYFTASELSVIAVLGFVMLSGIIVNNGIVMVDYINQLREKGIEMRAAILEAGRTRLRPVLMTALTTIFGLLTMAFSKGMGADLSKPMALVTIGGLTYGTLLTLLVIPCIYEIFHRKKKK